MLDSGHDTVIEDRGTTLIGKEVKMIVGLGPTCITSLEVSNAGEAFLPIYTLSNGRFAYSKQVASIKPFEIQDLREKKNHHLLTDLPCTLSKEINN